MPALFRPSRLKLRECLVSGDLPVDTLLDMIRDGRCWDEELDRNGPRLYFGDSRLNNKLFQREIERIWGWGWLRENPDIDIDASTIVAPKWAAPPAPATTISGITQETLRVLGGIDGRTSDARPNPEFALTSLQIASADFYRLCSASDAALAPALATSKTQSAAQNQGQSHRRGPPPQKRNRVLKSMEEKFCSGLSELDELKTWSGGRLARAFHTSRSTAERARKELLSKYDQD